MILLVVLPSLYLLVGYYFAAHGPFGKRERFDTTMFLVWPLGLDIWLIGRAECARMDRDHRAKMAALLAERERELRLLRVDICGTMAVITVSYYGDIGHWHGFERTWQNQRGDGASEWMARWLHAHWLAAKGQLNSPMRED